MSSGLEPPRIPTEIDHKRAQERLDDGHDMLGPRCGIGDPEVRNFKCGHSCAESRGSGVLRPSGLVFRI
jgi:hypothetical protein